MKHEVTLSSLLQIHNMVAVLEVISSLEKYPITKEALEVCHPLNMIFLMCIQGLFPAFLISIGAFLETIDGLQRIHNSDIILSLSCCFRHLAEHRDPFWAQISILGSTVPVCAGHYINHHSSLMNSVVLSNITLQFWSPL